MWRDATSRTRRDMTTHIDRSNTWTQHINKKIYDAVAGNTTRRSRSHTPTKKFYTRRDERAKRSHLECDTHIKILWRSHTHTTWRKKFLDAWATRSQCAAHTSDKISHINFDSHVDLSHWDTRAFMSRSWWQLPHDIDEARSLTHVTHHNVHIKIIIITQVTRRNAHMNKMQSIRHNNSRVSTWYDEPRMHMHAVPHGTHSTTHQQLVAL